MAERSLETTRLCLLNGPLSHSSGGGDDDHDDDGSLPALVTDALLLRPPFGFLRAVVALHVTRLGFAEGLFSARELGLPGGGRGGGGGGGGGEGGGEGGRDGADDLPPPPSRREKISFLTRILACVALVTGEPVDVTVSPSGVLSGDPGGVPLTHAFLRALVRAARVPPPLSREAAAEVLRRSEAHYYRRGVRARGGIVRAQAAWRGREARRGRGGGGLREEEEEEEEEEGRTAPPEQKSRTVPPGAPPPDGPRAGKGGSKAPPKYYVDLDGKKKLADDRVAGPRGGRTPLRETPPKSQLFPVDQTARPPTPTPTKPRPRRCRHPKPTCDASTSVQMDDNANARDMTKLHVEQMHHREAVYALHRSEAALKVRLARAKAKEEEIQKREAEVKRKEERVERVAGNLRRQQVHLSTLAVDRKAMTMARNDPGRIAAEDTTAAEIKGLRKKLFRVDRKFRKREEQVKCLIKRLRKREVLIKTMLRKQVETCPTVTACTRELPKINKPLHGVARKLTPFKPNSGEEKKCNVSVDRAAGDAIPSESEATEETNSRNVSSDRGIPRVSFSDDTKAMPSSAATPIRSRRAAYVQTPEMDVHVHPLGREVAQRSSVDESSFADHIRQHLKQQSTNFQRGGT